MFLVIGELSLYIAYADGWSRRDRIWPWISALAGLAVSVAGNVGHIQSLPGATVTVTTGAPRRPAPSLRSQA